MLECCLLARPGSCSALWCFSLRAWPRWGYMCVHVQVLGQQVLKFNFPKATSKTWCMTYTDADTRLVRAGSDGAYSPSREMGLYAKDVGLAKDSFLFFMTKEPEA